MVLMSFTRVLTATGLLLASSFFAAPAGMKNPSRHGFYMFALYVVFFQIVD